MFDAGFEFINEEFFCQRVTPQELDDRLDQAWRHFGTRFFRYNLAITEAELRFVIPLRIRLADLSFSKSQRRILNNNLDLQTRIGPAEVSPAIEELFDRHKTRFSDPAPDSIREVLGDEPAIAPADGHQVSVALGDRIVAASYFDVGARSVSSVYAVFDPELSRRSLGNFTLLKEIEFAIETGKEFFHLGYTYAGRSFYDYKKRFRALERYDWRGNWTEYEKGL
jgi:arginine-tRNA-protein transferase